MTQIWRGCDEANGQFILSLDIPTIKCKYCRQVIHDLKHQFWPKGKALTITMDKNVHGHLAGYHVSWQEEP